MSISKHTREIYAQVAQQTGLLQDSQSGIVYGQVQDYSVILKPTEQPLTLSIEIPACRDEELTKEEKKKLLSYSKVILKIEEENNLIDVELKGVSKIQAHKLKDNVQEALDAVIRFLSECGFQPCCQVCGELKQVEAISIDESFLSACDDCFSSLQQNVTLANESDKAKKENIFGGVLGALIGSLIGMVFIIFVSQLGKIAVLSGIVMAFCTLKGYEIGGHKLTKKGIIFSLVLMVGMIYLADRLDWAIVISRELEEDFFLSFKAVPDLIKVDVIEKADYIKNLVSLYIYSLIGVVPIVWYALTKKDRVGIYKMKEGTQESVEI